MIEDSLHVKNKDPKQFYQTLPEMLCCLEAHYKFKNKIVLDAGSGEGVIANHIRGVGGTVLTLDKYFPADIQKDFLEYRPEFNFDYVVMNPPYNNKYRFIDHGLSLAKFCIVLLPLQVLNYIDFCDRYLSGHYYVGRILMFPKVILNETGGWNQGGHSGYGWFVFKSQLRPRAKKFEYIMDMRTFKE